MSNLHALDQAPKPIRFEIQAGQGRVNCDVADEALEGVSRLTTPSTPTARRQAFQRFRTLIHAAAEMKLATMPPGFTGPLLLSSGDLRRVTTDRGAPAYGTPVR